MAFPHDPREILVALGHPDPYGVPEVTVEHVASVYRAACRADLVVVHGKSWRVGCFVPGEVGAQELRRHIAAIADVDLDDRETAKAFDKALADNLGTPRPKLCRPHFGAAVNAGALA